MLFVGGLAVDLYRLLWAEMNTAEALHAPVAYLSGGVRGGGWSMGRLVSHDDVLLRADADAGLAPYTLVGVHFGLQKGKGLTLDGRQGTYPSGRSPRAVMVPTTTGIDVGSYRLHARGELSEFPLLVVGVATKTDSAAVGHTHLMAIVKTDTFAL